MEDEPIDTNRTDENKIPVTLYLKKGEVVRIETVSPEAETHIVLRADEEDGTISASRKPENFPIQLDLNQTARPLHQASTDSDTRPLAWQTLDWSNPKLLFAGSLLLYFVIRVIGLAHFPIFFFSDEAMPVIRAQQFLNNGLRSQDGTLLPAFFKNTFQYSLGTTVYLQALGYGLFGKSIFVTRLLSVLSTLPAAFAMGWIFKRVYDVKYWFVGTLLFSIVPAWFLHSRTAFELVTAVSMYAVFIYFYFAYRESAEMRHLAWALTAGALCFYSYNPGRLVMVASGLFLFISDIKFHWEQRANATRGLGLLLLLILPYMRHQWLHPQSVGEHLYGLGSYWVRDIPTSEALGLYFQEYLSGLNPSYWYLPEQHEWVRHHMKGYGHLSRFFAPFALWGLILCGMRFRQAKYRNLLLLLLAAPMGAALVDIYITRAMFFVVPATLITTLGLIDFFDRIWEEGWLQARLPKLTVQRYVLAIFLIFAFFNLRMVRDALANGPTWYDNYGLGGLQYGATQVFGKAEEILDANPGRQLYISNTWTNGTNTVGLFFFEDPLPFRLVNLKRDNLKKRYPMNDDTLFILSREDYEAMIGSNKFTNIQVLETILWPNQVEGFYVVDADYVENIDEIFAAELEELRRPREIRLPVSGHSALITYPALDLGRIEHLFDDDVLTLARTYEGNPANYQIQFDQPAPATGLRFDVRDRAADITATVETADGQIIDGFVSINGQSGQSIDDILFDEEVELTLVTLRVHDPQQGAEGHVHLWEIELLPEK